MDKPQHHIFLCKSFRTSGDPQGVCHKQSDGALAGYIESEVIDRGLDAQVTTCGCLKVCDRGPVMVVYPQGWWYGGLDEDSVDEILDQLEEGAPAEQLLIAES